MWRPCRPPPVSPPRPAGRRGGRRNGGRRRASALSPPAARARVAAFWMASAASAAWLDGLSTGSRPKTAASPVGLHSSMRPPKLVIFSPNTSRARLVSADDARIPHSQEGQMPALPLHRSRLRDGRGWGGPRHGHGRLEHAAAARTGPCGRGGYCGRYQGRRRCAGCCRRSRAAPPRCERAGCRPAIRCRGLARVLGLAGASLGRKSSKVAGIASDSDSRATRSMAFASSRTLPGQR